MLSTLTMTESLIVRETMTMSVRLVVTTTGSVLLTVYFARSKDYDNDDDNYIASDANCNVTDLQLALSTCVSKGIGSRYGVVAGTNLYTSSAPSSSSSGEVGLFHSSMHFSRSKQRRVVYCRGLNQTFRSVNTISIEKTTLRKSRNNQTPTSSI